MSDYPTETADILEAAADILETRGWCQRRFHDADGAYCAVGSLLEAAGYYSLNKEVADGASYQELLEKSPVRRGLARQAAAAVSVPGKLCRGASTLQFWNDTPGRTRGEVIDLFKNTAKDIRNVEKAA